MLICIGDGIRDSLSYYLQTIANASRSMEEKLMSDRDYTYSELERLKERLGSI